jgi:hypothetical protein
VRPLKVSEHTGAFTTGETVIVFAHVTVPPAPVAVRVYVFVLLGETLCEPFATTAPIPWSIEMLEAFVVVHESVEL